MLSLRRLSCLHGAVKNETEIVVQRLSVKSSKVPQNLRLKLIANYNKPLTEVDYHAGVVSI